MKLYRILLISAVLPLFSVVAQNNCDVENNVFSPGERLEYNVYYNVSFFWINAGNCQFNVRNASFNGKSAYQFSVEGKSLRSFDPFYRVRDTLVSYVDSQSLTPFKAYKFTHEDNWYGIDDYTFNKVNDEWRITTKLFRKKAWKPTEVTTTLSCGFDILTSFYRLRCFTGPMMNVPGKTIEIPVHLDDGEYKVSLTYLGKEKIKLHNVGYYNAQAFTITLVEGKVFKRGDKLKVWLSDDKNNIPLLIESPIKVGQVKAVLNSAVNTKYPLQLSL